MCTRDRLKTSLSYWVFAFIHGFRFESSKISEQEKRVLGPFLKEQKLTRPCQAEIFQFTNPHRIVLLFFFDSTKNDCERLQAILQNHNLSMKKHNGYVIIYTPKLI
jgi:hypothetical protein